MAATVIPLFLNQPFSSVSLDRHITISSVGILGLWSNLICRALLDFHRLDARRPVRVYHLRALGARALPRRGFHALDGYPPVSDRRDRNRQRP